MGMWTTQLMDTVVLRIPIAKAVLLILALAVMVSVAAGRIPHATAPKRLVYVVLTRKWSDSSLVVLVATVAFQATHFFQSFQ
jgi:hypothetical protein